MTMAIRRALLVSFFLAGVVACRASSLAPLPLLVTIEASRTTAAPGDTINFLVSAQGGSLIGLETVYGDGTGDLYGTSGARTGRVTFRHAFSARGTFTVRVTATDATAGQATATVDVRVN